MRLISWIVAALALALVTPAFAQEWDEFVFVEDGFKVNFPGRPRVENTTWVSRYRYTLPARLYTASRGAERYSLTVVDYRGLDKMGAERSTQCPAGAEPCIGNQDGRGGGILGPGYWKMDVRGALAYATLKFLQRDAVVEFSDARAGLSRRITPAPLPELSASHCALSRGAVRRHSVVEGQP
jgi:hypothetical protein